VTPADEALDTLGIEGAQVDLGLKREEELIPLERLWEIGDQLRTPVAQGVLL
jgi:hypothetical protein